MTILYRSLLSSILLTFYCSASPQFKIQERDLLESKIREELLSRRKLNLYGLSGMGKTVSSRKIKKKLKDSGYYVAWLNWDEISFEEQIYNMLKAADCASLEELLTKSARSKGLVLIIDNYAYPDADKIKVKLGKLWEKPKVWVLITSQLKLRHLDGYQMPPFLPEEGVELMGKYFPEESRSRLTNICSLLGSYPYYISVLSRHVEKSSTLSLQRLEDTLMHNPSEILNSNLTEETEMETERSKGLVVIKTILEELKKEDYEAYQALGFLSLLGSKSIPLELIHFFIKDKRKADYIIEKLLMLAFIASIHKGNDFITYDLHDITQRLIRETLSSEDKASILNRGAEAFISFYKENYSKITDSKREAQVYFNHLNSLISLYSDNLKTLPLKVILLKLPLMSRKNFEMAAHIATSIEKYQPEKNINDQYILFEYFIDQSFIKCYFHTDNEEKFNTGINYGKKAIKLAEKKGNVEQAFKANSRLMWIYLYAGKVKESTPHLEKASALLDKISDLYSRKEYFFGASWYHLECGNFREAYTLAQKGIELDEKSKNANIGLYLRQFKAVCEYRFGELDAALQTIEEALRRSHIEFADETSFAEAELLQIRASIYRDRQLYEAAEKDIKDSINLFIRERGDNPYYANAVSHRILADILFNQNKLSEASAMIEKSMDIFRALVKEEGTYELAEAFFVKLKIDLKRQDFNSYLKGFKELRQRFSCDHEVVQKISRYTIECGQEWLLY
ncbi:tetratricopeptide repeat protein [Candidatus Odyssella thessalonicensis]|uniref:tetratricopeptide repeat protein n=1 Tax=Candidatus Odyssella thessalonicensis TaxID=84647 RepID=UPI000225B961|nr:tetratricopeptide repeat protein [Candidatus Odyssella thessalonicensis]